ncbi:MAG: alpha/beta hydrolase [Gammaproteobacteria bacterium]|nr:alpha/beta hydrolase [Gammaproteobacteria bacterium]
MSELMEAITIDTAANVQTSIIWLHGLGADGNDFVPIAEELGLDKTLGVRFVFPHAPRRPITINNGMVMRGWYDIDNPDLGRYQDLAGIKESAERINGLVDKELSQNRSVVLAGFSQGGVIALQTGLHYGKTLKGILVLSSYLARQESGNFGHPANRNTPIMLMHGVYDPVVPLAL